MITRDDITVTAYRRENGTIDINGHLIVRCRKFVLKDDHRNDGNLESDAVLRRKRQVEDQILHHLYGGLLDDLKMRLGEAASGRPVEHVLDEFCRDFMERLS